MNEPMLIRVTDYQDRGPSGTAERTVFIQTQYVVAMEPWGAKYRVFVGRSLEYTVSADDAERLASAEAGSGETATPSPPLGMSV